LGIDEIPHEQKVLPPYLITITEAIVIVHMVIRAIDEHRADLPVHEVDVVEEGDQADKSLDIDPGDAGQEGFDARLSSKMAEDVEGDKEGAHEEEGIHRIDTTTEDLPGESLDISCNKYIIRQ